MKIIETARFLKKADKLTPKLQKVYSERLRLFATDPYHPLLNNHRLSGDRRHQRSINITGDWRLIFERSDENTIRLIDIDTHPNLYGK